MNKTFLSLTLSLALAAVSAYGLSPLSAGDGHRQPPPAAGADRGEEWVQHDEPQGDASDLARRWMERMRNLGRRNANEKNHEKVLAAFTEITSPASYSTALIFSGDEPAAFGTVVAKDGYILTKASQLTDVLSCRLRDGRHLSAELIGLHADHDLAMLKIDADDLTPVVWHDVKPALGSWMVTPGIDDQPLAIGVVSAAMRRIQSTPGVLGVALDDGEDGAKITEVMKRGAAEKAGLKEDDIVLSVNGKRTKGREALVGAIRELKPGERVKLKVRRGENELDLSATLGSSFPTPIGRGEFQDNLGGSLSERRAGFAQAIQHDTMLAAHECGGPVVDLDGKAIGINIARAGRVASYALPANLVLAVIEDLKSGKLAPLEPSPSEVAEAQRDEAETE